VVANHAYLLTGHPEPTPLRFSDRHFTDGRLGVVVFMVVSGYLVCGSWLSDPDWRRFTSKRVLRIWPGLLLMLLVTVAVIGPLVTNLSVTAYATSPEAWGYLVRNALVLPIQNSLPGVFAHNPMPYANKVLWTLGVEVAAYAALLLLGLWGLLRKRWLLLLGAVVFTAAGWDWLELHAGHGHFEYLAPRMQLFGCFFAGAAVKAYGWRPNSALALAGGAVLMLGIGLHTPLSLLIVPCATAIVLYLGTRAFPAASGIVRLGDPSYGAYIYGYTIQQLLIAYGLRHEPPFLFTAVSLASTLLVGYLSWHLIERRALAWKPQRLGLHRPDEIAPVQMQRVAVEVPSQVR
jgi:peptidoglycan/LPS O-acetylase OafA/YrhL